MFFEPAHRMTNIAPLHRSDADTCDVSGVRPRPGVAATVLTWMQQGICGLHGHEPMLQYDRNRLYLRCVSCGHETAGWEVGRKPLSAKIEPRAQMPADLSVVRKIA
jgi:hypothetical protein